VTDSVRTSVVKQIDWCQRMGSPLYAELLTIALADFDSGGPVSRVLADFEGDAVSAALPLRLMGGVHRLVLEGVGGSLSAHFPTVGGDPDGQTLAEDFLVAVDANASYLREALVVAPQTNEIGRSAALLPGLGVALEGRKMPVRLLEIGSSAGLNLNLDQYSYRAGAWTWDGVADAPTVAVEWSGPAPPLPQSLEIVERRGCDLSPLDATNPDERTRLLSFVWADQTARFERMRGALDLMESSDIKLDKADAGQWVAQRLADGHGSGSMTVLQHSVMWMYLPEDTRKLILGTVSEAGEAATDDRPLAHVRFEASPRGYNAAGHRLTVQVWPGGEEQVLATGHAHGAWVAWNG